MFNSCSIPKEKEERKRNLVQTINFFLTAVKQQLLDLGEKIGYVNTGLKEDEISRCLREIKGSIMNDLPVHVDKKCSICQVSFSSEC